MPVVLPNTTTADAYPGSSGAGSQIGLQDIFESGFFVIANAAVFGQYFHGERGQTDQSPDIYMPPGTYPLTATDRDPLGGIRFRSAVAGTPAQVFGVLYYKDEAKLLSSAEFTATVSAGGVVTPGAPAAMQLIQDQLLIASSPVVTFGSIPATFKQLHLVWQARSDPAALLQSIVIRFNGDSGNNYDWHNTENSSATTLTTAESVGITSYGEIGYVTAATAAATLPASGIVDIPNYASSTFQKEWLSQNFIKWGTAANNMVHRFIHGGWRNVAIVNQLDVLPAAGNFIAGSRFSLYGY